MRGTVTTYASLAIGVREDNHSMATIVVTLKTQNTCRGVITVGVYEILRPPRIPLTFGGGTRSCGGRYVAVRS